MGAGVLTRVLLSWVNHVDAAAATFSAASEAGDFMVENLQDPLIGLRWRPAASGDWAQVDFGGNVAIDVLLLRSPRDTPLIGAAETIRHLLDADGGTPGTGAAYDSTAIASGTQAGYGYHVHRPPSTVNARYWRFVPTFAASFVDFGRAWAGPLWQPSRNFSFQWEEGRDDLSGVTANPRSGAEFVDERSDLRRVAFSLEAMNAADRDQARELVRVAGQRAQLVAYLFPDAATAGREVILGRLAAPARIRHDAPFVYAATLDIRESA